MTTFGILNITVQSLASLNAGYELSLTCCEDIKPVSSKSFTLLANQSANVSFDIYTTTSLQANHSCKAVLLSSSGKELHTQAITFGTTETNFQSKLL